MKACFPDYRERINRYCLPPSLWFESLMSGAVTLLTAKEWPSALQRYEPYYSWSSESTLAVAYTHISCFVGKKCQIFLSHCWSIFLLFEAESISNLTINKYIHLYPSSTSLLAETVKASAYNAGDPGSIPGWGGSSGEGNGNPLQYSCLENPMDGGAW